MNAETYNFEFGIEADYLVLTWKRLQHTSDLLAESRYPELTMRINFRDISTDTVSVMLKDLEVPRQLSQAIMTLVAAQAA